MRRGLPGLERLPVQMRPEREHRAIEANPAAGSPLFTFPKKTRIPVGEWRSFRHGGA